MCEEHEKINLKVSFFYNAICRPQKTKELFIPMSRSFVLRSKLIILTSRSFLWSSCLSCQSINEPWWFEWCKSCMPICWRLLTSKLTKLLEIIKWLIINQFHCCHPWREFRHCTFFCLSILKMAKVMTTSGLMKYWPKLSLS